MEYSVPIGERLREERARLGMSQPALGDIAGVTKKTQMLYEAGTRTPDALYLAAIAGAGADIQYIVTGIRSAQALSRDEVELIEAFRAAPLAVKAAAIGALQGGSASTKSAQSAVISGNKNSVNQSQGGTHEQSGRKARRTD